MTSEVNKGHLKVILKFQNHLFLRYSFCLTPYLLKTIQECQYYDDKIFSFNEV